MSRVSVKVVIDSAHLDDQAGVEREISALGMTIERTAPEIGTIFGLVEENRIERLRRVDGVLQAKPEGGFRIPALDPRLPQ